MNKIILLLLAISLNAAAFAQDKPAYVLYDKEGKKVKYGKMLKALRNHDLVFFGEYHNNPIAHWLQLELTRDLGATRSLVLGAEMFEADNQQALNDYLQGKLTAKGLDSAARLWKNYTTDYAPLVNYAKAKQWPFIATNIPRKYAALVAKKGFGGLDSLTALEKSWIAPLPVAYDSELPGYKNMMEMMQGHGSENMPKAQAIKDATMAHFILANYKPGSLFIHYNGSYHSENYEGITWYIRKQNPSIHFGTITVVSQKDIKSLEAANKGKADYIICVDEDMTTTY